MYAIFQLLLERDGLSVADVSKATGIRQSTLSNWKKRDNLMGGKNAQIIADFFGVSVDYLMTGKDTADSPFTPYQSDADFMKYIHKLWNLPNEYRQAVYKQIGYAERDYQEALESKKGKEKGLA